MEVRFADARRSAPDRPHPRTPDQPPPSVVANSVAAPLDALIHAIGHGTDETAVLLRRGLHH